MTVLHDAGTTIKTVAFARDLGTHGDKTALITPDAELSYRDLNALVEAMAERLGRQRRLILLTGANTVDAVVTYLAALISENPLLLVPGDDPAAVQATIAAYDPDVVIEGTHIEEKRAFSSHHLHPDLALLLSTSGSTGSAKLVRLSHENLQANAESIADYLHISSDDRAATTLPMHYCYGLSVINSHLFRGAGLILTQLSVADQQFWNTFAEHRGTSFAGVPYTFDLLDRIAFDRKRLPHLRYVTQAGGRLCADRVRHYAELAKRDGWELFVMYGQTEATARMAYLPAHLAASHPECIGVAIPGGSFRLADGELVYSGPNVMLGYANEPSDLELGRTIDELATGDLARLNDDGLYEIVGRKSRFIKSFGLRIDLDRMESALRQRGVEAYCAGDDDKLVVAFAGGDAIEVKRLAAQASGVPAHDVRVCPLTTVPRLSNGKPDYPAIAALAQKGTPAATEAKRTDLRALFAEVLDCPDVTDMDTFVGLGGDSLSYVQMSIRLERALGHLPDNWHTTQIGELKPGAAKHSRRVETSVALRALSIVLVVGTHAGLWAIAGGAHLLLGVAGFNFGRFQLTSADRQGRMQRLGRSIGRIAIASMAWIAVAFLITDSYRLAHVFLLNYFAGIPRRHNDYWFIETLVYILVAMLVLLSIPWLDRIERKYPFGLPLALMSLGLITRYGLAPGSPLPTPARGFWLFAIGWAAAKATTRAQRLWVTVAILATVPGYFGEVPREGLIMVGLILLVWVSAIPSTRIINSVAGVLAGASLYIYLTHWQIFPLLARVSPLLALLACLGVGIGYGYVVKYATPALRRLPAWLRAVTDRRFSFANGEAGRRRVPR